MAVLTTEEAALLIKAIERSGLLDELELHSVSVILGAGERLLEGVGSPRLELAGVVDSPAVTSVRHRVTHGCRS